MFTHYFAGCLIFWILGRLYGWEITAGYLLIGSMVGALPDWLSLIVTRQHRLDKWSHLHRDNFTHSVFLPLVVFGALAVFDLKIAGLISVALLTHPLLDLFGIGWGVKLLYPFSSMQYKLFYKKGKIAFTPEEIDLEASMNGNDHWIRETFFRFNVYSVSEWGSFMLTIIMIWLAR